MSDKMLNTAQVAARLHAKRDTVIKWCRRGVINATRHGSGHRAMWLIDEEDLVGFVKPKRGRPPKSA